LCINAAVQVLYCRHLYTVESRLILQPRYIVCGVHFITSIHKRKRTGVRGELNDDTRYVLFLCHQSILTSHTNTHTYPQVRRAWLSFLYLKCIYFLRFGILIAMTKNSTIFWDLISCWPVEIDRRFGRNCCLHLQGRRINQNSSKQQRSKKLRCSSSVANFLNLLVQLIDNYVFFSKYIFKSSFNFDTNRDDEEI
jgi:hypothetical protein